MARKKSPSSETSQKVFPSRLRSLMEARGVNQPQLAAALGVQRQTISNYACGQSSPDWESLVKLAEFFNVSADYLLGLSPVATVNQDVKFISEYTGLAEQTIQKFHKYAHLRNHESNILGIFDSFVNLFYERLLIKLYQIRVSVDEGKDYLNKSEPEPGVSSIIYGPFRMKLFLFTDFFRRIPNALFGSDEIFNSLEEKSWIYTSEELFDLDSYLEYEADSKLGDDDF